MEYWKEACTHSYNWNIPFDGVGHSFNFCVASAHTCSIEFRSYDWGGQVSTWKFCIDNHRLANFAVCLGSSSCWNETWEGLKWYYPILFMTPSWRMRRYKACVIFPSILHMWLALWEVIQPLQKLHHLHIELSDSYDELLIEILHPHPTPSASIPSRDKLYGKMYLVLVTKSHVTHEPRAVTL
jgi:hypothetical protein